MQPVAANRANPESPSYKVDGMCEYNLGAVGHDTDDCWTLKRAVEDLIEVKAIVIKEDEDSNMTNNSFHTHNNSLVIGMIYDDREFDPAYKIIIAIAKSEDKSELIAKSKKKETPTPHIFKMKFKSVLV